MASKSWEMFQSFGVTVSASKTKVDNMQKILPVSTRATHKEVVRFDVAVNKVLFVNRLNPRKLNQSNNLSTSVSNQIGWM